MNALAHSSPLPTRHLPVIAARCLLALLVLLAVRQLMPLGTALAVLATSAVGGVLCGSWLAQKRVRVLGIIAILISLIVLTKIISFILVSFAGVVAAFTPYAIILHIDLAALCFAAAVVSSWAFGRSRHHATLELVVLVLSALILFSGHRNFHFDLPKAINSFAWAIGIEPVTALVLCGSLISALVIGYLALSTHSGHAGRNIWRYIGGAQFWRITLIATAFVIYLLVSALGVLSLFQQIALSRIANGVGQATGSGMSPLGFHSALGSTNQPAALLRLEGDYTENPFSPMMYLRETALSEFNGKEMVQAPPPYDLDITRTDPTEAYAGTEDTELGSRVPITQSIYLLADHKSAFALDYPISLKPLHNPNPKRFKSAYRAYSIAPGFTLGSLRAMALGNPKWDQTTREHYLKTNPDPRYSELAKKLSEGHSDDLDKVISVITYLSKNAIYTLTPNHDEKDPDQVASFLFGDMRGYCVHFAHATVYLLRSLGIPSRIGTGYLTDLSQAKDGHTLLRVSDRHAWAEVYIDGRGWIPFDTQPEHVENHAETDVDMKLLEELMGMLDPGEEILPKEIGKDSPAVEDSSWIPHIELWHTLAIAAALLTVLLTVKLYLRFGWILPGSTSRKLTTSYRAVVSLLHDLGIRRQYGETREEFRARILRERKMHTLTIAPLVVHQLYMKEGSAPQTSSHEIAVARNHDILALNELPRWKRVVAFLNPSSTINFLGGEWW